MKNYYDQLNELKVAQSRLKSLKEKKKMYFNMTQPKSAVYFSGAKSTNLNNDAFLNYLCKTEKIDNEIIILNKEIKMLSKYLKAMENSLRNMNGSLEKVFVLRYIDGLSVKQICRELHYSKTHVYRKLSIIRKILKDGKKGEKNCDII